MQQEPLRFKKSSRSAGHSDCVEVAHSLRHIRDSKDGSLLRGVDIPALIRALRTP